MWPHRWQPSRLPCPWDSPGKNTGVGCHFLLQCRKVNSESEVAQLCPTPSDPMDCSLPGSSVHGICQARVLEWGATAFSARKDETMSKPSFRNFSGGPVVKNPPANAGDTGSIPGPGRFHTLRSSYCSWIAPISMRSPCIAVKHSPRSLQLEKAHSNKPPEPPKKKKKTIEKNTDAWAYCQSLLFKRCGLGAIICI